MHALIYLIMTKQKWALLFHPTPSSSSHKSANHHRVPWATIISMVTAFRALMVSVAAENPHRCLKRAVTPAVT